MGFFDILCVKCAKYLAFGTYSTPAVGALREKLQLPYPNVILGGIDELERD